jgi:hypothetical protein
LQVCGPAHGDGAPEPAAPSGRIYAVGGAAISEVDSAAAYAAQVLQRVRRRRQGLLKAAA